jgi:two-component system, NarL family, invasion response regulator UvrY
VRDDSGKVLKWYGTCTDVEQRRQAEDTLRRNQAFFVAEAQRIGSLLKSAAPGDRHELSSSDDILATYPTGGAGQAIPAAGMVDKIILDNRRLVAERQAIESLTSNERAIVRLITDGKSNAQVGELLHLSPRTVETYRARLMEKLQLEDLVALVKFAIRHGMTAVD